MTNLGGKIELPKVPQVVVLAGRQVEQDQRLLHQILHKMGKFGSCYPNRHHAKTYDQGYIHVKDQLNNDQGTIIANGGVDVESQNGLDNQGGQLNLGHVKIQGERF